MQKIVKAFTGKIWKAFQYLIKTAHQIPKLLTRTFWISERN